MNKEKDKRIFPKGLLVFALVILTNPVVNIFDYLPDLFGYLIIVFALAYFAPRVPYFEEARVAFRNLAILAGAKIPAYFVMTFVRGQNYSDNDIKALFAFTFSVIEVILLISALTKLLTAIAYLGKRSDAQSLISSFAISKRRKTTPDKLMKLCLFFVVYKGFFTAVPEMLLLTRGVSAEDYGRVFNVARLYPYTILFAVISVFVLGIIVCKRFSKFLEAIYSEGKIYDGADSLNSGDLQLELENKIRIRNLNFSLWLIILATIPLLDVRFDNLSHIDILPDFLFGIFSFIAIIRLTKHLGKDLFPLISASLYSVISLISYVTEVIFLTEYGYGALAMSKIAKSEYITVMIWDSVEFVSLCVLVFALCCLICKFIIAHIGLDVHSANYSRFDAKVHTSMRKRSYAFGVLGILCGVTKTLDVIFRYPAKVIYVATDNGSAAVCSSFAPWFGSVAFLCSVIFIGFTIYLFTKLCEEVELKYS